ncbi:DUF4381 family protein [uncultured Pseudoteredinibacter sp.]|uniref:DUF4381 family protein n=1 Tax=uncultured Pseudoteredinibacter sp. TaxID=1641701 RepID=UPI00261709E2|nr:DUF4381 family protein [uncultured Pseudoteredinibacter sp.]
MKQDGALNDPENELLNPNGQEGQLAASIEEARPDFWFQGFGNDWLEHFYELDSAAGELPSGLQMYIPKTEILLLGLAFLLLILLRYWLLSRLQGQLDYYRLEAQSELDDVFAAIESGELDNANRMAEILQRCLLVFAERKTLSSLSERQRVEFINQFLPSTTPPLFKLDEQDLAALERGRFEKAAASMDQEQLEAVHGKLLFWVKNHKVGEQHVVL